MFQRISLTFLAMIAGALLMCPPPLPAAAQVPPAISTEPMATSPTITQAPPIAPASTAAVGFGFDVVPNGPVTFRVPSMLYAVILGIIGFVLLLVAVCAKMANSVNPATRFGRAVHWLGLNGPAIVNAILVARGKPPAYPEAKPSVAT